MGGVAVWDDDDVLVCRCEGNVCVCACVKVPRGSTHLDMDALTVSAVG